MAARAGLLGDPTDIQGNPQGWVVGAPATLPDLVLIVASDSRQALRAEVQRIKDDIADLQGIQGIGAAHVAEAIGYRPRTEDARAARPAEGREVQVESVR